MGADDFLVTASNQDAVAWIEKWPDWPAPGLVLSGEPGSGKSHLLNLWLGKSQGRLVSVDELTAQNSRTLTESTIHIAIDDADGIVGNAEAEESLFHLYNHLKTAKGSLFLTMTTAVGQAGFALPDLRSRLLALPAITLGAPDDALVAALLVKQFRDRQIALDAGVISYVTAHAARDAASIRDLVERLDCASLAEGRKITIALARKLIEDAA
jgi:chromosomal replication initiation ATPase DnaA